MRKVNIIFILILSIFLLGFNFLVENQFYKSIVIYIMINAINASLLNILFGYTGVISLGQAAFFGIGAYTSGILTVHFGVNPFLTIIIGALVAVVMAYIIGLPTLKLHGHYLAMATLGFGMIIYILFNEFVEYTGGPSGLTGISKLNIFGILLDYENNIYIFLAILFIIFTIFLELFDKS
ncbi:MAG: branched-chain amino acid ABC transporter permease, partial [Deferribacterales bacterium]